MKNRQADHFIALVAQDDVVIRQFTIRGNRRLFEIEVQNIRLGIIAGP